AATLTDASGTFTFPAVPPGDYVLRVTRLPREPVDVSSTQRIMVTPGTGAVTISGPPGAGIAPPPPPPIPADATLCAGVPLSVGDRALTDAVVTLTPGRRVPGRVDLGGVLDKPSADSIATLRITLEPTDGTQLSDNTLAFQTGRPGKNFDFSTYG